MKLAAYMEAQGLDDAAMAARIGPDVSPWAVRKWRYGQRAPRRPMQRRVEAATGGSVSTIDFFAAVDDAAERQRAPQKSGAAVGHRSEATL